MKNLLKNWPLFIALGLILSFSSCKKADTTAPADNGVSASDDATITNAVTANADDAALAADGSFSRGANGANLWGQAICGGSATVDSATKTVTIVYDGTSVCNGVIRAGTVTITLTGSNWKDAGATLTVSTSGLKITNPVDSGYFTISGSHAVINESGGVLADLITTNDTITRRHTGEVEITFANNTTRKWNFDRTRSWSTFMSGGQKYLNVSLSTEAAGGVAETGDDRFNQSFTDKITTPVQADNYKCSGESRWNPYVGDISHNIDARTTSITFGTNASGSPVGSQTYCSAGAPYGYYITYTNSNKNITLNKFVSYYWH